MKKLIFLIIFFGCFALFSQSEKTVLNTFTFEEVEKLYQKKPKSIVVFIYTDWCKICHGMKQTTLKDDKVIRLLNNNFYFILLNGEEKKEITFLGKTFVYKPTGTNTGIHELANELAAKKGRIAYPTATILNTNFEVELQLIGLISTKKMIKILVEYQKKLIN